MTQPSHAPAPTRRRANPFLTVVIVLLVLGLVALLVVIVAVVVVGTASGGSVSKSPTQAAGTAVEDGKFGFRVIDIRMMPRVDGENGSASAKGHFVLVRLWVTNQEGSARSIVADDQRLHAGGRIYAPDPRATVDVDRGPEVGLPEQINPAATEEITVVFDVPNGVRADAIEVHGNNSSPGAVVALPET